MWVLVDKTFQFVEDVWSMNMERNMQVTRYVHNYRYVDNVNFNLINILYRTTAASGEDEEQQQGEEDESDLEDDGDDMHKDDDVVCDVHEGDEVCLLIWRDVCLLIQH